MMAEDTYTRLCNLEIERSSALARIDLLEKQLADAHAEVERMRGIVDKLRAAWAAKCAELEAEVEKWKQRYEAASRDYHLVDKSNDKAVAEVERLRGIIRALLPRMMANHYPSCSCGYCRMIREAADAAKENNQ